MPRRGRRSGVTRRRRLPETGALARSRRGPYGRVGPLRAAVGALARGAEFAYKHRGVLKKAARTARSIYDRFKRRAEVKRGGVSKRRRFLPSGPVISAGHVQRTFVPTVRLGRAVSQWSASQRLLASCSSYVVTRMQKANAMDNAAGAALQLDCDIDGVAAGTGSNLGPVLWEIGARPVLTHQCIYRLQGSAAANDANIRWVASNESFLPSTGSTATGGAATLFDPTGSAGLVTKFVLTSVNMRYSVRGATSRPSVVHFAIVSILDEKFLPSDRAGTAITNSDVEVNNTWREWLFKYCRNPVLRSTPMRPPKGKLLPFRFIKRWKVSINPDDTGNKDAAGLQKVGSLRYCPNRLMDYSSLNAVYGPATTADANYAIEMYAPADTSTGTLWNTAPNRYRLFLMCWPEMRNDTSTWSVANMPSLDYQIDQRYVYSTAATV